MKYKEALKQSMNTIALDSNTVFMGYNVRCGSKANGTLVDVPEKQLIETPVAENLMLGMAIGMSLEGYLPVVYFERFDFILPAMDALVNHLDKIHSISKGEFSPNVIIRAVVGGKNKPLFTGSTHTQDLTVGIQHMVNFPVYNVMNCRQIFEAYDAALKTQRSTLIVEYRDNYDLEYTDA